MTAATAAAPRPAEVEAPPHTLVDDALGLVSAVLLLAFGLFLLRSAGAVTGGAPGLALLVAAATPVPFAVLLVAVNVPFLLLGLRFRPWRATVRSLVAIGAVAALAPVQDVLVPRIEIAPAYAVLLGNVCAGVGLIVLFRHGATLGGFGVVALILQERLGWRAGVVQLVLDLAVILAAFSRVPVGVVLLSAAGALVLDLILAVNHRPGRYRASSR